MGRQIKSHSNQEPVEIDPSVKTPTKSLLFSKKSHKNLSNLILSKMSRIRYFLGRISQMLRSLHLGNSNRHLENLWIWKFKFKVRGMRRGNRWFAYLIRVGRVLRIERYRRRRIYRWQMSFLRFLLRLIWHLRTSCRLKLIRLKKMTLLTMLNKSEKHKMTSINSSSNSKRVKAPCSSS